MTDQPEYFNDYYQEMHVDGKFWSTRYPNRDEVNRATKIMPILTHIASQHHAKTDEPLMILDVGSGRGWLSHLLMFYGQVQGVEPVQEVVEHARKLYPYIEFTTGTPQTMLDRELKEHFDVIVSSEVIEHVPYNQQEAFMLMLSQLLKPEGYAVLTTPRAEIRDVWMQKYSATQQPIEDWLTEQQLLKLAHKSGFTVQNHMRFGAFSDAIRNSVLDRLILKILNLIGYQFAEPARYSTYQLIQLQKSS